MITPKGMVLRTDIEDKGNSHRRSLFGYAGLKYVELAELHKYYQDAQSRGVDVNKPFGQVIYEDPALEPPKNLLAPNPRSILQRKICKEYKRDYITRITCNQQTRYQYTRNGPNGWHLTGGCDHYAMTAGKYDVEITIWTQDGFRLDYTVPITVVLDMTDDEDEIVSKPEDIAKQERQKLARLAPNDPDTRLSRASLTHDIQRKLERYFIDIGHKQPLVPADVLAFLKDDFDLVQKLHQFYPNGYSTMEGDLWWLVEACAKTGSPDCLALAQKATAYLDQHIVGIRDMKEKRRAYWYREICYRHLADLTITAAMDINACRILVQRGHEFDEQIITPTGGKASCMGVPWYLESAPQAGWWRSTMDEHRPANFSEIASVYYGTGGRGKGEGEGEGEGDLGKAGSDWLKKRLNELMSEYDAQQAWLASCTGDGAKLAFDRTQEAWQKLQVLRVSAEAKIRRIASLYAKLHPIPPGRSDDYLEDYFQWELRKNPNATLQDLVPKSDIVTHFGKLGIRAMAEILGIVGEDPPQSEEDAANAFIDMIAKEQKKLIEIRRQQRGIIDHALEAYKNIDDELDTRLLLDKGEKRWVEKDIPEHRKLLAKRVEIAKLQMYCAAGMNDDFNATAKVLIDKKQDESMVRFFQGVQALQYGKHRVALTAFRYAFDLRAGELHPDHPWWKPPFDEPEKVRVTTSNGTKFMTDPIATSLKTMIQELEVSYVKAIEDKTMADSQMIRAKCRQELSKHGDPGFIGYIKDLLTTGVWTSVPAIGDKLGQYRDLAETISRAFTEANDADKVAERGGFQEILAERQGVVLTEARLQQIGFALITRLRQAGLSLQDISKLNTKEFMDATSKHFHLKGTAAEAEPGKGWDIDVKTAQRMLITVKLAMQNKDMDTLVQWSGKPLDVETGKSYYELEEFDTSLKLPVVDLDVSDAINVWNIFMFLGPNAMVDKGDKNFFDFARPTPGAAAKDVMTLKEAIATKAQLPKLAQALGKLEGGGELMRDFLTFYNESSWVGRWTADGLATWAASEGGRVVGRVAAMRAGASDEDAEWWAKTVGEISMAMAAFGVADVDVAKRLAQTGARAATVKSLTAASESLGRSIVAAEKTARMLEGFTRRLDGIMDTLNAGKMNQAEMKALRESMNNLKEDIFSARSAIKSGNASQEMRIRNAVLEKVYSSMEAASFSQPEMGAQLTKTVKQAHEGMLEHITDLKARSAGVTKIRSMLEQGENITAIGSAPPEGAADPAGTAATGRARDMQLDYNGNTFADADALMAQNKFRAAARSYEQWLEYMGGRKMQGIPAWQEATDKLQAARRGAKAQARWHLDNVKTPKRGPRYDQDFSPEELKRLSESPDLVLKRLGKGASDPWFVCEQFKVGMLKNGKMIGQAVNLQPVAVFKPDTPRLGPFTGEAEDFFSWLSGKVGLNAPAAARGKLNFDGRKAKVATGFVDFGVNNPAQSGTFVRYVPGAD